MEPDPAGPAVARSAHTVHGTPHTTFHVRWLARLIATPFIGVMALGLTWGIVASIVTRNWRWPTQGEGTGIAIVGWIVVGLFWFPTVFATLALWRYRVTISADRIRYRAVFATRTLPLGRVESVRVVGGTPMTAASPPRFDRVDIRGRTAAGKPAGTSINSAFVSKDMGLAALTAWVQARPEIVHDDPVTRAFFGIGGIGSTSGKDDSRAAPAG